MKQYNSIKAKHPGALLLFRVGDFYETFLEDAVKASRILGIVLTKRANGSASSIELAGFPYHSLDSYLPKLVRAGERVAICEQLEDPKTTKTIVKRGVTELITPGIALNDKILDHKQNNYLASIHIDQGVYGVAFIDISTGEFLCAQGNEDFAEKVITSLSPSELLFSRNTDYNFSNSKSSSCYTFKLDDWIYNYDYAEEQILRQYRIHSLKGFGIEDMKVAIIAAGSVLHYLKENYHSKLDHIQHIARIDESSNVWLDKFTIRNLEIIDSLHENATTLLDVIDDTTTPMGTRLLRKWVTMPLVDVEKINSRLSVTNQLIKDPDRSEEIFQQLSQIGDLERLISRVSLNKSTPRELVQLKDTLLILPELKQSLKSFNNKELNLLNEGIDDCVQLSETINSAISEDAPVNINKGNVIRSGYSEKLDDLRSIAFSGKEYLIKLQQREVENTGITSLKIGFNNVFGYYIEVTNTHKSKVPDSWIRKQTLVNSERYITDELKTYEEKILTAEDEIQKIEIELFQIIIDECAKYTQQILKTAFAIAQLDCLASFSKCALKRKYVMPLINDTKSLQIKNGRHPVLETQLPPGENYIPNDIILNNEQQQMMIITGPNMSGKSALLRQTALIVLLAQIGSFVPAESAEIGIVDKIFTRVGASDNISSGESTFMVEMNETASILNNLSDRSLVILDEIGRGTATYDGISIAWSIAEYIHNHSSFKAKTLFATHYHELTDLESVLDRVFNYHISIKETQNDILFLRKLVPGGSEHSFGIHVARMAGMPSTIVKRAGEMLKILEKAHSGERAKDNTGSSSAHLDMIEDPYQLSIFKLDDPLLEQLRQDLENIDLNSLTPVEALIKLSEIQQMLASKNDKKAQNISNKSLSDSKIG